MNALSTWRSKLEGDDVFFDNVFVGRQQEMDILCKELLVPEPRMAAIVGNVAIGKTSLALWFGHLNRNFFSSGIYHVHSSAEPLSETVDAHVKKLSGPYLIVIDEADKRFPYELTSEIHRLRKERPSARLIFVSRQRILDDSLGITIALGGLSRTEFADLLSRTEAFANSGAEVNEDLFAALNGNPVSARQIAEILKSGSMSPQEVLRRLSGFTQSGVIDSNGTPIISGSPEDQRIIVDVRSVSNRLIEEIYANPSLVYELSPRRFEELVAEVLACLGYSVNLTPVSRDGGKDIYAAKKDHLGSFLFVVECKRYAPDSPVGVGLVRQLNGVVQAEQATAGILVTTSFFTKDAREFQRRISHQMALKDFFGIQEWLQEVFRLRGPIMRRNS